MATSTPESKTSTETPKKIEIPEEFKTVVIDLKNDILNTFPEYAAFINKWARPDSSFDYIEEESERKLKIEKCKEITISILFEHCKKKIPPRFFDILYQKESMFDAESDIDTEFLPHIHFKNLWQLDISDRTKETIWGYLKLIALSVVGNIDDPTKFGDTTNFFKAIDRTEFKDKVEETIKNMKELFEKKESPDGEGMEGMKGMEGMFGKNINIDNLPDAEGFTEHISSMLDGKLGQLAKDITKDLFADMNIDETDGGDTMKVFDKLFKNPANTFKMVEKIGAKLDENVENGSIKKSELYEECYNMIDKAGGMDQIHELLGKMGMGNLVGKGSKLNLGAMKSQMENQIRIEKQKERMKKQSEKKKEKREQDEKEASTFIPPLYSEEEIIQMFSNDGKTDVPDNSKEKKSKKNKKKK